MCSYHLCDSDHIIQQQVQEPALRQVLPQLLLEQQVLRQQAHRQQAHRQQAHRQQVLRQLLLEQQVLRQLLLGQQLRRLPLHRQRRQGRHQLVRLAQLARLVHLFRQSLPRRLSSSSFCLSCPSSFSFSFRLRRALRPKKF
jgi:hypothetical protein